MKNNIILHIPHSSKKIPKMFWDNVFVDKSIVLNFVDAITDVETDKLFGKNKYKKIVFSYSRVFCDVEKFADDEKEIMSQFGMGAIYTHTNKGEHFFKLQPNYKNYVLKKYYYSHHKELDDACVKLLKNNKQTILIDCHSFGEDIIMFKNKKQNLPDICLGFEKQYNVKLVNFVKHFFESNGYSVKENYPYEGTMIPNGLYGKNIPNFNSIMIEVNKTAYTKSKQEFLKLQKCINSLFKALESFEF